MASRYYNSGMSAKNSLKPLDDDTIAALATPQGRGGIGIIRVSGQRAPLIATTILGRQAKPRYAEYGAFKGPEGELIDVGLLLFFQLRIPLQVKMSLNFMPTVGPLF